MSAPASVLTERRQAIRLLADLVYRMIAKAARRDEAAPAYTSFIAEARRQGLAANTDMVKAAVALLVQAGRIARIGQTSHQGYLLPGTELRTQSSCQPAGFRRVIDRGALRCPTLEERTAMFAGQRYEDVPHREGRIVSINPYLETHGWASPLAGE